MRLTPLLMIAAVLAGCVEMPRLEVFNNSGAPITVRLMPAAPWAPRYVRVERGGHAEADMNSMLPPGLVISVDGCDFGYQLPQSGPAYIRGAREPHPSIKVQVQPDLSIAPVPVTATASVPASAMIGAPVRPRFNTCVRD